MSSACMSARKSPRPPNGCSAPTAASKTRTSKPTSKKNTSKTNTTQGNTIPINTTGMNTTGMNTTTPPPQPNTTDTPVAHEPGFLDAPFNHEHVQQAREDWAHSLKVPEDRQNSLGMSLVLIP